MVKKIGPHYFLNNANRMAISKSAYLNFDFFWFWVCTLFLGLGGHSSKTVGPKVKKIGVRLFLNEANKMAISKLADSRFRFFGFGLGQVWFFWRYLAPKPELKTANKKIGFRLFFKANKMAISKFADSKIRFFGFSVGQIYGF